MFSFRTAWKEEEEEEMETGIPSLQRVNKNGRSLGQLLLFISILPPFLYHPVIKVLRDDLRDAI